MRRLEDSQHDAVSHPGLLLKIGSDRWHHRRKRTRASRAVVPGVPDVQPPTLVEPSKPRGPLPPKADQQGADTRTATGAATEVAPVEVAQQGAVFFIQDGIKFPDVIHAAKPHPDREIPQAHSTRMYLTEPATP